MFKKRPSNPKSTTWAGVGLVTFSLVLMPIVISDPWNLTRHGIPAWLLTAVLLVVGAALTTYGAAWLRRDGRAGATRATGANEREVDDGPPRRYKWRYGPLRLLLPWISIAVGGFWLVRAVLDPKATEDSPVFLILGISLIVLGIVAFLVYRWMAKRGI